MKVSIPKDFEGGLEIALEGLVTWWGDCPVFIEHYEGQWRVVIWNDPESGDPTHIINLGEKNG